MKHFSLLAVSVLLGIAAVAQSPSKFNYQAVARDAAGVVVSDGTVGVKVSILSGSASGTEVYSETHSATTNVYGMLNFQIGAGSGATGDISTINWGSDAHFIKVEMDPAGGTSYTVSNTSELISVPYAEYANSALHVDDADADSTNEVQTIILTGDSLVLSIDGGTVDLSGYDQSDDVAANTTAIADNAADIATNAADIATNATDIATNATDLASHITADMDVDSTNELITDMVLDGDTMLQITEDGVTHEVDLTALVDDGDWVRSMDTLYNNSDSMIAIGTNLATSGYKLTLNPGNMSGLRINRSYQSGGNYNVWIDDSYSNSSAYGVYSRIYSPSGNGFGIYNFVYDPSSYAYGSYNNIYYGYYGYGTYNYVYDPDYNAYGTYNRNYYGGTSYGTYNQVYYPASTGYGTYNYIYSSSSSGGYGTYNSAYTSGTTYGSYNLGQSYTGGSSYSAYGSYNYGYTTGSYYGNAYGSYNYAYAGSSYYDYAYGSYNYASGGYYGNYASYSSGLTYSTGGFSSSDRKLKKNIRDYDGAISDIMQLQPRVYEFDVEKYPTMGLPESEQYGLVAQELEEIFPTLVKSAKNPKVNMLESAAKAQGFSYTVITPAVYDEEGELTQEAQVEAGEEVEFKAVNYTALIPVLIKGIQEQQAVIEANEAVIEDLKARIETLENN